MEVNWSGSKNPVRVLFSLSSGMYGLCSSFGACNDERQHDRRLPSLSPNHNRLTLSVVEDFIQARLSFSLIDGLHGALRGVLALRSLRDGG